ncbi:hypothetical protein ACGFI9_31910 [Micromonospora sp. NPDC048930]|uniref:hypothetical protein n=1 Tax=Micromonospora sp. NPDC048930 TaxID=3364261 RepID=UPI003718D2AE
MTPIDPTAAVLGVALAMLSDDDDTAYPLAAWLTGNDVRRMSLLAWTINEWNTAGCHHHGIDTWRLKLVTALGNHLGHHTQ